jgi:DNA-binding CsgD family transcriptional regulator
MTSADNPQIRLAAAYVQNTNTHIFLTGKAGTGKTTFLRNLKQITYKRFVVVAPTGVAAINAGGVTIHSFFQLPFGPQLPETASNEPSALNQEPKQMAARFQRFTREKINIIRSLDLLVIDEISMVRADLLDAIDAVLRRYKDRNQAFGGIQLLMIGDLQQLAPIARDEDWDMLKNYYDSVYFFSSRALNQTQYISIELNHVYRQADQKFIRLLNNIRDGNPDQETFNALNKRYQPEFVATDPEGYITLTTHNNQANEINQNRMLSLNSKVKRFEATIKGDFPEYLYPTLPTLELKTGAQVMFVKNDPSPTKSFYNGKIGKLVEIDEENELLTILCEGDDEPIVTGPLEWQHAKYSMNEETKEIEENVIGTFTQIPLKLAWAITIHKSQGLTFEKAIIDAQSAFAHGQVYVALSRCRSLEGMVFRTRIPLSAVKGNPTVGRFMQGVEEKKPDESSFEKARHAFQLQLLHSVFDFTPLHKHWGFLIRLAKENSSSIEAGLPDLLQQFNNKFQTTITDVANKFLIQLRKLAANSTNLENDEVINNRLKSAALYFSPFIDTIYQESELEFETDNKAVKKNLQEVKDRFQLAFRVQKACIETLKDGFKIPQLLEARAKAAVDVKSQRKKTVTPGTKETGGFYQTLKTWRNAKAEELDVDYYQVLPSRTMKEIASALPESSKALAKIHGMGKMRIKNYGEEILSLLANYVKENNIDKEIETTIGIPSPKPPKIPSARISYELFLTGKTIAEIANERGMAVSTVESHLSDFIRLGNLELKDLMKQDKIDMITEYFTEVDDPRLGPAKDVLGEEVSYSELRWVLTWLQAKGLIEKNSKTL